MHIKRNEAENFFFPLPKIKQDFSKRRIYEKSPAQGSTLKRNFKIILTVSKAHGFFSKKKKKKREQAIIFVCECCESIFV